MPPRCTCDMAAGTAWDTVPIWEQKWPATLLIPAFTPGMTATLNQVQLRRHAGGRARRCRALGAGGACSDSSEKCTRRYRRLRRGGVWEPGLTSRLAQYQYLVGKLPNLLVGCFSAERLKFIRKLATIRLEIVDVPFWALAVSLSFGASKPLQI